LPPEQKVDLFRQFFRGRTYVYPQLWVNTRSGKKGYSPACSNEWRPGVCDKPRIKCSVCPNQAFLPVTEQVILDHLQGRHTIGVYPLLADETCWFLAVDFDKAQWRDDVVKRLAAFQNPELYKKQSLRLSTALTPRVITCAEDYPEHLSLPRGCRDDLDDLLQSYGSKLVVEDLRVNGNHLDVSFRGDLTNVQAEAATALLQQGAGVLIRCQLSCPVSDDYLVRLVLAVL
jgi:hypothetical protein